MLALAAWNAHTTAHHHFLTEIGMTYHAIRADRGATPHARAPMREHRTKTHVNLPGAVFERAPVKRRAQPRAWKRGNDGEQLAQTHEQQLTARQTLLEPGDDDGRRDDHHTHRKHARLDAVSQGEPRHPMLHVWRGAHGAVAGSRF